MQAIINPRLGVSRSGKYEIRYSYVDKGRTLSRYLSTHTEDRREAEAYLKDWLRSERVLQADEASPRVVELLDRYLKASDARGKGETQAICVRHLKSFFADHRVVDIDSASVIAYEKARGVSGPTIRRELGVLTAAFNLAVKDRLITLNDRPIFDLPAPGAPRTNYLHPDQIDAFLQAALDHTPAGERLTRLTRFVFIALETGARAEAIRDLRWSAVDLERRTIDFRNGAQTNKRRVLTSINDTLLPILQRAKEEATSDFVLDSDGSVRRTWETWIAKTQWPWVTPHALRKSFASAALKAKVDPAIVAAAIGDSVQTMLTFYAFIDAEMKGEATDWRKKKGAP